MKDFYVDKVEYQSRVSTGTKNVGGQIAKKRWKDKNFISKRRKMHKIEN